MATTLLAVDDSNTMRKVLEITFAGEDYRTIIAATSEEAMSKLASERPEVALIDAGLDGDGYSLCQRIKGAAPNTAVILLTSKLQPYDRTRGGQVGADDFVDKPFDTQQLLDRVRGLAGRTQVAPSVQPSPAASSTSAPVRPRAQTLSYGTPAPTPEPPVVQPSSAGAGVRPRTPTLTTGTPPGASAQDYVRPPSAVPFTSGASNVTSPGLAPAIQAAAANGLSGKLNGLGLTAEQVQGVLSLSREIIEQAVWEVVPTLAETMIREELDRLTREL